MLTVKRIIKDVEAPTRNSIQIWEAKDVQLIHRPVEITGQEPYIKTEVYFTMRDGGTCSIDTGIVYVMNETGKTVETFRLNGSECL